MNDTERDLRRRLKKAIKKRTELNNRNMKAIEYIGNVLCDSKARVRKDISGKEIDKLIYILRGVDKE